MVITACSGAGNIGLTPTPIVLARAELLVVPSHAVSVRTLAVANTALKINLVLEILLAVVFCAIKFCRRAIIQ